MQLWQPRAQQIAIYDICKHNTEKNHKNINFTVFESLKSLKNAKATNQDSKTSDRC